MARSMFPQSVPERAALWQRVSDRDRHICALAAYSRPDGPIPSVIRTWSWVRDAHGTLAADAAFFATLQTRADCGRGAPAAA